MTEFDTIVVGVGGVGSSTVYHLSKKGVDVLGIERFDIPNSMGSSHGDTRIIRLAYHEDTLYVSLLRDAYKKWVKLQEKSGENLLQLTGSLTIGKRKSETFKGALQSCKKYDLEHEILDGNEFSKKFPGYSFPSKYKAVWQPNGGFLACERCIVSHVKEAKKNGAEIHAREKVKKWKSTGEKIEVQTNRDEYKAQKLIITTGAWVKEQVNILSDLLKPERHIAAWFQPKIKKNFEKEVFPVFVASVEEGDFYGFPSYNIPGFKIGEAEDKPEVSNLDEMDRQPTLEDEKLIRSFTSRYFPDGSGPTLRLDSCLVTRSPDDNYILDKLPNNPNIVVGCGFSGHGFKLSSVTGEILANLSSDGKTKHEIARFKLNRFQNIE